MVLIDCDVQEADTEVAKSIRRSTDDVDIVRKASLRGVMLVRMQVRMQVYSIYVGGIAHFHFPIKTPAI